MRFKIQVPTGRPADGRLVTVITTSPYATSALAFALIQTGSNYNIQQFRPEPSQGIGHKFVLETDNRVCAYVSNYE